MRNIKVLCIPPNVEVIEYGYIDISFYAYNVLSSAFLISYETGRRYKLSQEYISVVLSKRYSSGVIFKRNKDNEISILYYVPKKEELIELFFNQNIKI